MPVETSGIDHVHLHVTDLLRAIDRFTAILDCEHGLPYYVESIQAMNSMSSLGLDVFEPKEPEGIAARQMARFGGPGINTVSFLVEDLDAATGHIEGCGVPILSRIGFPGVERQTQFRASACHGMVLELIQYEPGHEAVIAEIQAKQSATAPDGRRSYPAQPGALGGRGIDHVHLRVDDIDGAQRWFSRLFRCEWDAVQTASGAPRAAAGSIGIHLVEAAGEAEGLGSLAFAVDDLAAADALGQRLGLRRLDAPDHAADDACLRFDPRDVCALPLELVPTR